MPRDALPPRNYHIHMPPPTHNIPIEVRKPVPAPLRPIVWALTKFNSDPSFQFHFHVAGSFAGFFIMIAMPLVYFLAPGVWRQASILALVLITDYGNLTTDYCGVSDAEASGHGAALRGIRRSAAHHALAGRIFDKLALDAHFQYRIHLALTYNWAIQGLVAILVFSLARPFWNHYALLYTLLQNGYTNFGTDFSALPGTLAARHLSALRGGRSPWAVDIVERTEVHIEIEEGQ